MKSNLILNQNGCTLVLNADAVPLSIVPLSTIDWKEAIKNIFLDKLKVVEYYDDWILHSPSMNMNVPSIVMLKSYVNKKKVVKYNRHTVYARDLFTCQYCSADHTNDPKLLTLDHVVPRALGGKTTWDNIITACYKCNSKKAHHTSMKPKTMPYKPTYYDLIGKAKNKSVKIYDDKWIPYLDWPEELIVISDKYKKI